MRALYERIKEARTELHLSQDYPQAARPAPKEY